MNGMRNRVGRLGTPIERFFRKVSICSSFPEECWMWVGGKDRAGYGVFKVSPGRVVSAHRFIFEFSKFAIPKTKCVCHRCDVPACVNPNHLWLGSLKGNIQDCIRKKRFKSGRHNLVKTHCIKGHPFSGENLFYNSKGYRKCRACSRLRQTRYNRIRGIERANRRP